MASTNGLVQCLLTALVVRPQVRRINCCIPWGGATLLAGQPQLGQPQAKDDVNLLPAAFRSVVVLMLRAVASAPPATTDCACVYLYMCVCMCICGCANHATVGMQILKQSLKLLRAEGSHFATDCSAWLVLRFGFFSQHAADPRLISGYGYGHGQVAVLHLGSRIFHLLCLPFSPAKAGASAAQIQLRIFSWFSF